MNEERVRKEYTRHFQSAPFFFTPKENQFCFIDNDAGDSPYVDDHEKQMFQKALAQIKDFTKN